AVHPIADAINAYAQEKKVPPLKLTQFQSVPGFGLQAIVTIGTDSVPAYIGHQEYIARYIPATLEKLWKECLPSLKREGHLNTLLLLGDKLFSFHFIDTLRPHIKEMIEEIKNSLRIRPVMLTGDHAEIAQIIAKEVGIEEVYADLRPADKLEKVAKYTDQEGLIMIGDGVNDAPSLARASVGISMGKIGSATAIDASDIVFLNDDIYLLGPLISKAHQTHAIVKQNISLALLVILLATTSSLFGLIPLWIAVLS
ncbi:MAG: HAD-IC family P-type ATPase, partial [Chlamydiales bacterium]|nr:HAD-IC family P-type ATPase [Chlamydiales bacterium]